MRRTLSVHRLVCRPQAAGRSVDGRGFTVQRLDQSAFVFRSAAAAVRFLSGSGENRFYIFHLLSNF